MWSFSLYSAKNAATKVEKVQQALDFIPRDRGTVSDTSWDRALRVAQIWIQDSYQSFPSVCMCACWCVYVGGGGVDCAAVFGDTGRKCCQQCVGKHGRCSQCGRGQLDPISARELGSHTETRLTS